MHLDGICGPMYARKTSDLIIRAERVRLAGRRALLVKPDLDGRYSSDSLATHGGVMIPARVVPATDVGVAEIAAVEGVDWLGVDEVQFFPRSIVGVLLGLVDAGVRVVWAGLDMDSKGWPFGPVPLLMAVGGVTKLTAVCVICGDDATHTHRHSGGSEQVEVGAAEKYSAMCRRCWRAAGGGL